MKRYLQSSSRIALTAFATVPAFATVAPVMAQDEMAAPVMAQDELVVTATRRAQSVQDVPYNITAISGDELSRQGIADVSALIRTVPGAVYIDQGARSGINNSTLILRGLNAEGGGRDTTAFVTAPVVSTYVNETPIFVNLRLRDIERVEILRGPQGTLYGSGSLGGSVRYIYNKPELGSISGNIVGTQSAGNPNYEIDGVFNAPLGDMVALRVSAGYVSRSGFIDQPMRYVRNEDGSPVLDNGATDPVGDSAAFFAGLPVIEEAKDINGEEIWSVRGSIYLEPTDNFNATLSYHHQEDRSDGRLASSTALYGADTLLTGSVVDEPFERDVNIASAEIEYEMGFASFTGSASYYKSEGEGQRNFTGLYTRFPFYEAYYGTNPRPLVENTSAFRDEGYAFEARLASNEPIGGVVDWVAGFFYLNQDVNGDSRDFMYGYHDYSTSCFIETGIIGGAPCGFGTLFGAFDTNGPLTIDEDLAYVAIQDSKFRDIALFGEFTVHVTDRWQVTGGARWFDQKYQTSQIAGLVFTPGGVNEASLSNNDQDALFKANTSYAINDNTNVYFTWSEGFRRAGANALPDALFAGTASEIPVNPKVKSFRADRVENLEVGVKGRLFGRGPSYTLAYFNIDWDDIQTNTACTALPTVCAVNAGKAKSQGVELEVQGNLTDRLDINFGYTYVDAKLKELSADLLEFNADGTLFSAIGVPVRLPGTPKHSAFIGANFTQPLQNDMELVFGANGSYRSEARSDLSDFQNVDLDGFWLLNLGVTLNADAWSMRAFVNNVADERGATGAFSTAVFGDTATSYISMPRTYGLTLSYRFGQ